MLLTIIEQDNGSVSEACLQMLTLARKLGEQMEAPLSAALFGEAPQETLDTLQSFGVASVYAIRHAAFDSYAPEAMAKGIVQLIEQAKPRLVMAAGTECGNELLAHTGAQLRLPMAANCVQLQPGEPFRLTRFRWGGSLLEDSQLLGEPKLVSIALHSITAEEADRRPEIGLETFTPSLQDKDLRVKVLRREKTVTEGVTLKNAPVVVGGGRGVGSEAGYRVLEELASLLGGAVGGSRVATNNGWRSHSEQIGLTGNRIAPELYIACGISGAIQHLVGCKGAKRIMVINKDPEAPFFSKADYGVVGDLHEVLPAVIEEIKKEKAQ
jgi:electron transfer flavoprotein alpha subunit